jgi:uncharacterized membrane protein HdeD (DUF308 family)
METRTVSKAAAKFILLTALILQLIGLCTLHFTDPSSTTSTIALWIVISAGIVEVILALCARRQEGALHH